MVRSVPGDAELGMAELYLTHYRSLVRLAALLVPDPHAAEDIVQDSFVAAHGAWALLPDADDALCYLRRLVVRRSRSVPAPVMAAAHSAVVAALWKLPSWQREILVLRYFADLPDAQVAAATGIRPGTVASQTAEAVHALRAELGSAPPTR